MNQRNDRANLETLGMEWHPAHPGTPAHAGQVCRGPVRFRTAAGYPLEKIASRRRRVRVWVWVLGILAGALIAGACLWCGSR
jgi:hypothetical protein